MPTAYLLDFEDSFTLNIAAELALLGVACHLRHPKDLHRMALARIDSPRVVILGPGPGHPVQYKEYFSSVRDLGKCPRTLVVGICLGHQIWWAAHGAEVVRGTPCHGRSVTLRVPAWPGVFPHNTWGKHTQVQRYNSLTVVSGPGPSCQGLVQVGAEMMMSYGPGFLTYQFHPESVGTCCPGLFLGPIRDFLYNGPHGANSKHFQPPQSQTYRWGL